MRHMRGTSATAGVVGCLILTTTAMAANAIDLTGEWRGTEVCDEVDGGTPGVFTETSPIFIRQRANGRFTMLFRLNGGNADALYEGVVREVAGGGHEAVAIACGGDFASQEVVRLRPIVAKGRKGLFNGESQFFTDDFPGSEGVINFGTCKYAYERVSTARPVLGRCVPSPIGTN